MGDRCSSYYSEKIRTKIKELFEEKEGFNCGFTELEWRIAASHFFPKSAITHLENLIEKMFLVTQVSIVISSEGEDKSISGFEKIVKS